MQLEATGAEFATDGALATPAASKVGVKGRQRDYELEAAKADIARLSEARKEFVVKLTLVEGKAVGAEWQVPHQVDAAITSPSTRQRFSRATCRGDHAASLTPVHRTEKPGQHESKMQCKAVTA